MFSKHAGYVWRVVRHLGVPEADIPDVCQEVFMVVHRRLPDFEGRSSVQTWLYGICVRLASQYRRRAYVRRERASAEIEAVGRDEASVSDARMSLVGLLNRLDEEKRQVVVLYEIEGMKMREVAYFLKRLDEEAAIEANGKTILENALITISTESGDGRHSNVKRELSGVFHAISSANGWFRSGEIMDVNAEGIDVYNTMLDAVGVPHRIGPEDRKFAPVDAIRT